MFGLLAALETLMSTLRIYKDALRLVELCQPHWESLRKQGHGAAAAQLERSSLSPALNIAEGAGRYDGNGRQRFETARGSAKETIACLDVGVALGALKVEAIAEAVDCADKIAATMWRLTRRRAARA